MAIGSEYRWDPNYSANLGYAQTSVARFDRFYDPDGNGTLSDAEIKAWDPNFSPPPVANDPRRFENTGNLKRPVVIAHGSHDPIVSPGETAAYKRLVEQRYGAAGARNWLARYYIPRMSHRGARRLAIGAVPRARRLSCLAPERRIARLVAAGQSGRQWIGERSA